MRFSPEIERIRSISEVIKVHFHHGWAERFRFPIVSGCLHDPERYLHLIEFEVPGADEDELWAGFETAYRELCQQASRSSDGHHYVALGYITPFRRSTGTVLRALVLVHPAMMQHFIEVAARVGSDGSSRLSISRCDFDHGDPDAAYRWFAEGISREAVNLAWLRLDSRPISRTDCITPLASQVEVLSPAR